MPSILDIILYEESFKNIYFEKELKQLKEKKEKELKEKKEKELIEKIYFNNNYIKINNLKNDIKNNKNDDKNDNNKENTLITKMDPTMAIDYPRTSFINRFKIPISRLIFDCNKLLLVPVIGLFCYSFLYYKKLK